jgi:hypothetical protein
VDFMRIFFEARRSFKKWRFLDDCQHIKLKWDGNENCGRIWRVYIQRSGSMARDDES